MLAIFAITFPILVLVAFFLTLWLNNSVLYPPSEFTSTTSVHDFVDAMDRNNKRNRKVQESAYAYALERLEAYLERLDATTERQRKEIVDLVSIAARPDTITVDVSTFDGVPPVTEVPVDKSTNVSELLDAVYFAMAGKVANFSYNKTWILRDGRTGRRYDDIGTFYAREHLETDRDYRRLSDVGIGPNASLCVEKLRGQAVRT
ncbi:MAG TPA: hypothetical protein VGR06_09130 [Actinophytocola sp.]|jgi:hypothetical protein|uniref:hypothetical protein n=1 Tax=Actinophytocola sp. TaxID=1872138 RepID=UPI002DFD69F0|nr:hypothetical protein [Actinophytocola sp.]